MSKSSDCSVCCEKYNLSKHKSVICPFDDCNFTSCKSCVRTYLLGTTNDPHCMSCKKSWEHDFLITNLNRAFCDKDYKNHRKELLVEREISKLPESMVFAEIEKKITTEETKRKLLKNDIIKAKAEVARLNALDAIHINNIYKIRRGNVDTPKETRKFIMACPNNICRGYLSTQYKCELCEMFTCHDCLEIIGYNKLDEHTCNPNDVASAETIRKETKPCPSCGVRIFKISGCSQMWCTECKVAFDYKSGTIDTGTIHNPHYYNHMRQVNNGEAPRNPQDIVCGGICQFYTLNRLLEKLRVNFPDYPNQAVIVTCLAIIHRTISHITNYDLPRLRQQVRENNDNQTIRIQYILGNIDKKQMATLIYRRDNLRKKHTELLHLYELINVVGIEQLNFIVSPSNLPNFTQENEKIIFKFIKEKLTILENLRKYCNTEFEKISIRYNHKVLYINDQWKNESLKY